MYIGLYIFLLIFCSGKADFAHALFGEKLSSAKRSILWMQHGVEIKMASGNMPEGLEVDIQVKLYDASDCFVYPQGYTLCSHVYEICVSTTQDIPLSDVQLSLTNFRQPRGRERCCIMEASRVPTKWESNLTPKYTFSEMQGQRFHSRNTTMDFSLTTSSCYLAIAGTKH